MPHAEDCRRTTRDASRRWCLALVGSALVHLIAASSLEVVQRTGEPDRGRPLTVTIETLPRPAPLAVEDRSPVLPADTSPRVVAARKPPLAEPPVRGDVENPGAVAGGSLPDLPDVVVYTASELDTLPVLVSPLDVDRWADPDTGRPADLRLEVVIDEGGAVRNIEVSPGVAGVREKDLRAALSAASFLPARKDGRPVKSRVTLSVRLGHEPQ